MADIFLSYASEDLDVARSLAAWLEHSGWSVWWDRKIFAGKVFDTVITRELNAARCVLVLWTRHSVASNWVKDEATEAADRQILVPVVLDEAPIPMGFRRIQAARLVGWAGDISDARLKDLRDAVLECAPLVTTSLVDAPKGQDPSGRLSEEAVAKPLKPRKPVWDWIVLSLIAIASIAIGRGVAIVLFENMGVRGDAILFAAWGLVAVISMFIGYRIWRKSRKVADAVPRHPARG
jgi:TIR domain